MAWYNAICDDGAGVGRVGLPLCKKGGVAFGGDYVGGVSGPAVQSASNVHRVALRNRVCVDGGGHGQYLQEIPVRGFQDSGECPAGQENADVERADKEKTMKTMPRNPTRRSMRVTG